jgi:uncharacterized membrane protein YbaN (DUF454 family)
MLLLLRFALASVFITLGVVGSLLPILQGWIFFLLAALVMFPNSSFAAKIVAKAEPRAPRLVAWLRKMGIGRERAAAGVEKR